MEQPVTVGRAGRSFGGEPEVLEPLVDASLTARVTLDEQGTVTGWNAGAERLLGYSAGELTGRRAADLLAEPIPVRGGLPTLAGLPRWNGDVALRHRDGRKLTVRILAHHRPPGADAPQRPDLHRQRQREPSPAHPPTAPRDVAPEPDRSYPERRIITPSRDRGKQGEV